MPERAIPWLRIVCLVLGGLLLLQLSRLAAQKDPLAGLEVLASRFVPVAPEKTPPRPLTNTNTNISVTSSPRPRGGNPTADLPAPVQARIERIIQSELFGQLARPMPMALLGIAGEHAFLRAPNGQVGLLREGEELGGVKILRIGANRVLVQEDQQQKELTIFSGFGSESLLPPKGKENPQ